MSTKRGSRFVSNAKISGLTRPVWILGVYNKPGPFPGRMA